MTTNDSDGEIDPSWWAAVEPAEWERPEVISLRLAALASEAEPGTLKRGVLETLGLATSAMLQPDDWAEPFTPSLAIGGKRSPLPSDLDEEQLAILARVVPVLEHRPMRARVADVAWFYGDRANLALLSEAIDTYRAAPLERDVWHSYGHVAWRRAIELARRRGRGEARRLKEMAQAILGRILAGASSDGFMLVGLSELLSACGGFDRDTPPALAEHLVYVAAEASTTDLRLARHLERAARRWFIASNNSEAADDAVARIARLYEVEADHRLAGGDGAPLAAGHVEVRPVFPERFGSLADARAFMATFVEGYNHHHRHTGIGLNTPADVHYGHAAAKATQRAGVLAEVRARNPERFATTQDPKILATPATAYINQPAAADIELAA